MAEEGTEKPAGEAAAESAAETVQETVAAIEEKPEGEPAKPPAMVPSFRLRETADRARKAEAEVKELKEKLASLTTSAAPEKTSIPSDLPQPPEGLDERQQIEFYIRDGIERHFGNTLEKVLGLKPESVAALLAASKVVTTDTLKARWDRDCKDRSLDPDSADVREMYMFFANSKNPAHVELQKDPGKILDRVRKLLGERAKETTTEEAAEVETDGVAPIMVKEKSVPWTTEEAMALASKGTLGTVAKMDMMEALRLADAKRKKAKSAR